MRGEVAIGEAAAPGLVARLVSKLVSAMAFALVGGALVGCTTVRLGPGGARQITAIGIVRLEVPPSLGDLTVVERTGVGFGLDRLPGGGAWLGYSAAAWIMADPAKCQMIVVIRSPGEAERVRQVLSQMGESVCMVDQSKS